MFYSILLYRGDDCAKMNSKYTLLAFRQFRVIQGCTLQWIEVQEDGGSPIYGYDVFVRKDCGDWVKLNDEVVFVRRYNVTGLEVGPLYEFKVEACNEAGLQSNSDVVSETLTLSATYGNFFLHFKIGCLSEKSPGLLHANSFYRNFISCLFDARKLRIATWESHLTTPLHKFPCGFVRGHNALCTNT